jgi:hypothetical protein
MDRIRKRSMMGYKPWQFGCIYTGGRAKAIRNATTLDASGRALYVGANNVRVMMKLLDFRDDGGQLAMVPASSTLHVVYCGLGLMPRVVMTAYVQRYGPR